ncbi:UDP-glycosyltransferase UGT5-like isoform X2 [Haematobia irritans]|uniref:UDP-glycosyltransferase UGT5-like isoform X2 n=1 Tax=Haematobia irritans TaxID=7368 RepID=UPI003F4F8FF4
MRLIILTSLLLLGISTIVDGARILAVIPTPSKSHAIIHSSVAETLAAAGHNVTVLSILPDVLKNTHYSTYIHIESKPLDPNFTTELVNKPQPFYKKINQMLTMVFDNANDTMNTAKFQEFLHNHGPGDFDLLILGYFMNDFMLGLGAHFQCPIVISFMIQPIVPINDMIGNPYELAYVPSLFSDIRPPMTFFTRVKNFIAIGFESVIMGGLKSIKNKQFYSYNFPADRYPPLEEVYKNVSLVLTNHHFSQGPIRPNVPAIIEIGGIQIKEKPDPLPEDLAKIMDSAKEGIIYFSFGSNVQGSHLSKEKAKIMFNALSKLPYKVLMKWGDSDFPGQSENIIYKSWLPQDDILAHANVKLFITHGGQGSVVESQYHGIPMVGIPFFGDQHSNMAKVEKSGFGLSLQYTSLTEEDFRSTILEVLNNPKYRENVQQFSKLYRDRPMTPRQLVRYWVDYVIRHNGAKHMQSPAVFMSWWQLSSIDVMAFLLAVIIGVFGLIFALCRCLCCRNKKASKSVNKAKKNQ